MYQYLGNTNILLYDFVPIVGRLLILTYGIARCRNQEKPFGKRIQKLHGMCEQKFPGLFLANKRFWVFLELVVILVTQYLWIGTLNVWFGPKVGTGANYFGTLFFHPLIMLALFAILGVDLREGMDRVTLNYPLFLFFAKVACFCHGCCRGIESPFGLYNQVSNRMELPVQLLEAWFALLAFVMLQGICKYVKKGTLFPIYAIFFSATRFFSEFLRTEKPIFGVLKTYQVLCLIGLTVGVVELMLVKHIGRRKSTPCSDG